MQVVHLEYERKQLDAKRISVREYADSVTEKLRMVNTDDSYIQTLMAWLSETTDIEGLHYVMEEVYEWSVTEDVVIQEFAGCHK